MTPIGLAFYILPVVHFAPARCAVPDMIVRKVDNSLIEQKRQDTLEMCRLYSAHKNHRITKRTPRPSIRELFAYRQIGRRPADVYQGDRHTISKRNVGYEEGIHHISKRGVDIVEKAEVRAMAEEDAGRLEQIIDQMYDETLDGENVKYNRRNVSRKAGGTDSKKTRRINFAPAELEGPDTVLNETSTHGDDYDNSKDDIEWPKKWEQGIVPYFIDPKSYDTQLIELIQKAFDYFEKATCIRLQRLRVRPDPESHWLKWIYISNPNGIRQCVHSNDQQANDGQRQKLIVFGYGCMSLGEIAHEVMHVLGFSHEHARPDRDNHVSILWDNIKHGYKRYFEARESDPLLSIPYDYTSVMHYPSRAFSKNGQPTIYVQSGVKLGQRNGLSEMDVEKVNRIFGHECTVRNQNYLEKTCSVAVSSAGRSQPAGRDQTAELNYYEPRIWPRGLVNWEYRDNTHFTPEERDNIQAVMSHIESETCIRFEKIPEDINTGSSDDNATKGVLSKTGNNFPSDDDVVSDDNNISSLDTRINSDPLESIDQQNPESLQSNSHVSSELFQTNNKINLEPIQSITQVNPEPKQSITRRNLRRSLYNARRHSDDFLELIRVMEPGCPCPTPGKKSSADNEVGRKVLKIASGCFNSVNDLLHLFVHVLGLDHQHNAHDRDQYLSIQWDNLTPEAREDLQSKLAPEASLGFPYDYQSVMHYPWLQIQNGRRIIMYPVWNDGWVMGHWQGLSEIDVKKLQMIYKRQCRHREQLAELRQ